MGHRLYSQSAAFETSAVMGSAAEELMIRTIGPARVKGLSAVADERCRTDKLDGVIKRRSSRETTMVGRGASLDGRLFLGGDRWFESGSLQRRVALQTGPAGRRAN